MAFKGKAGFPEAGYVVDHLIDFTAPESRPDCEWCGQVAIRYAHVLTHPTLDIALMTGCDCATVLTGDEKLCKDDADLMRLVANQRGRFSQTGWKRGKRGGKTRGLFGYVIEIVSDASGYKIWINTTEGTMRFPTRKAAEMRAFDHVMKKLHPKLKIQ
jgi:hypothetical protein